MMKYTAFFFAILTFSVSASAQQHACCASPAERFAHFSVEDRFGAAHLAPDPFTYASGQGSMITFPTSDGKEGSAYEVAAASDTKNVLLVIHEWWGLNDYIKQEAERLQQAIGDVRVLALDLYDGKVAATPEEAGKYMRAVDEARARSIIAGAIA